jgi:hypothetical protein
MRQSEFRSLIRKEIKNVLREQKMNELFGMGKSAGVEPEGTSSLPDSVPSVYPAQFKKELQKLIAKYMAGEGGATARPDSNRLLGGTLGVDDSVNVADELLKGLVSFAKTARRR